MAGRRLICASAELEEGRAGVRFPLAAGAESGPGGFAVRYDGAVCAFVNRCPHMGTELDWQPGEVFDESGLYLVCATHGAIFEPQSGRCIAGPCRGASLQRIATVERDGKVCVTER